MGKKTNFIGLLVPDIANPFFGNLAKGAEGLARKRGYSLILGDTEGKVENEKEYIEALHGSMCDGIILVAPRIDDSFILELNEIIPLVLVDRIENALEDADRLIRGGIDAIQVENQFDKPFLKPEEIGWETIAAVTAVVTRLHLKYKVPMGINIHLNGVCQSLAVAAAAGCKWVRAFELANAYISNAGLIEAAGPKTLRYRAGLYADDIMIMGDFHVKHGSHKIIEDRSLEEQAEDVQNARADGVIVTGLKTGSPPSKQDIERIKGAVNIPILIGSGLSSENLPELLPIVDGAIVGSNFKIDGKGDNGSRDENSKPPGL